jgi:hypothetical protein
MFPHLDMLYDVLMADRRTEREWIAQQAQAREVARRSRSARADAPAEPTIVRWRHLALAVRAVRRVLRPAHA